MRERSVKIVARIYKLVVSPLLHGVANVISPVPAGCRFLPTCSEYAVVAVERYGWLRGGWMAVGRLLRCHPFAHGGFDPVPERHPRETTASDAEHTRNGPPRLP